MEILFVFNCIYLSFWTSKDLNIQEEKQILLSNERKEKMNVFYYDYKL